ncbi:MAG: hypothetical protein IPM29_06970 [Planctomycetes bacterium]|nr:hypothetical protein [Planctomycetota bacterium]
MVGLSRVLATGALLLGSAAAQPLDLPPRSAGARTGAQLLPLLQGLTVQQREELLWQELTAGNVPGFLRSFVSITRTRADAQGRPRTVTFDVLPDYLALGSDADFFRMPMTPTLGQQLADRLGCSLPTRRMVDDIWAAAPVHLDPVTFSPTLYDILSPALFWQHQVLIEQQRAPFPLGLLVAGTKKDVVISALLATVQNRVVIYGWHRPNGVPIQPLYGGHVDFYADYSHGVRLVRSRVTVDGAATTIAAVLADPVLHPLLSDEGPFATVRYPVSSAPDTFPFIDPFGAAGFRLTSWRAKFTAPTIVPFAPRSPGGDGHVVVVADVRGGTESIRCGHPTTTDQVAQADIYCDYRPWLRSDGYERVGVFVRDRAAGAFDGTLSQQGACYALTWDSDDGRLRCLRANAGTLTDLLPQPRYLPSTAWRRFRIEARADELRFCLDGVELLRTNDATHPHGEFGIGYHESFATNANLRGTRADNWFADVPDALTLSYASAATGNPALADVTVTTTRGVPGDLYFRPVTVTPGAFPHGWFLGLDPALGDLGAQFASAHPIFVGLFDADGVARTTVPLPTGLTLYGVALDVFSTLPPVAACAPVAFLVR